MIVLAIGDIYGKTGRKLIEKQLSALRKKLNPDWVIANGENATGGTGLSAKHRDEILKSGVDVITTGNHIFARPDWPDVLSTTRQVLRPHNIGGDSFPGCGLVIMEAKDRPPIAVMNLAGRIFMEPAGSPFSWAEKLISRVPAGIPILLDFHAEATSEKIAMAWGLDGKVAAVVGTHTHVQTSDERILPGGTAAITDLGMTGPRDGILGVEKKTVLDLFQQGFSDRFSCAPGPGIMEGVHLEIGDDGKATTIRRLRITEGETNRPAVE